MKPFVVIQWVRLPPGKGAARQPEASVAYRAVTHGVKRTQRVVKRPTALEIYNVGAFVSGIAGAAPGTPIWARRTGPAGGEERRKVTGGITKEPGRPGFVRVQKSLEGEPPASTIKTPARGRPASAQGARERQHKPRGNIRYRTTKQ